MREQKAKEYLQTIYALQTEGDVRAVYIAREMNISKAAVSVALQTLVADGYVIVDQNHKVRLTPQGEQLAKTAIHETVHRGKSYHGILEKNSTNDSTHEEYEDELRMKWIQREGMEATLEALLVLGKHYYRVRNLDLAECLKTTTAATTKRIRRLEEKGFVTTGERSFVSLTERGKHYAEIFFAQHETARGKLMDAGLSEQDAELSACLIPINR